MLDKLKRMFSASKDERAGAKLSPQFEVLIPEERQLSEEPKMAARMLSFLFAAPEDITTFEFRGRSVACSNSGLKEFLTLVAGAKQLDKFMSRCNSMMFRSPVPGALGRLCCVDHASRLHEFTVFQVAPPPGVSWKIRREVLVAQQSAAADRRENAAPAERQRWAL